MAMIIAALGFLGACGALGVAGLRRLAALDPLEELAYGAPLGVVVATLALPFLFRPKQVAPGRADETLVIITPHNEALRYEFGRGFAEWYRARTGRTVSLTSSPGCSRRRWRTRSPRRLSWCRRGGSSGG